MFPRLIVVFTLLAISVVSATADARPLAAPSITRITPNVAYAGQAVTITGRNLTGARVLFRNVASPRVKGSAAGSKIVAVVPVGVAIGRAKVTVTTAGGTATSTSFKILPVP